MRIKLKATKKRRFIDSQRSFKEYCSLYSSTENPRKYFRWQKTIDREKLLQSLLPVPTNFQPALNHDQISHENLSLSQRVSFVKMPNLTESTFSKDLHNSMIFARREVSPSICLSPPFSLLESIKLQLEPHVDNANNCEDFCEEIPASENLLVSIIQSILTLSCTNFVDNIPEEKELVEVEENQNMNTAESSESNKEISFVCSETVTRGKILNEDPEPAEIATEILSQSKQSVDVQKELEFEETCDVAQVNLEPACETIEETLCEEQCNLQTGTISNEGSLETNETTTKLVEEVLQEAPNPPLETNSMEITNVLLENSTNTEPRTTMELENCEITPQKNKNTVPEEFLATIGNEGSLTTNETIAKIVEEVLQENSNPPLETNSTEGKNILLERNKNTEQKTTMELENYEITPQKNKNAVPEKFLTRSFQRLQGLSESIQKSVNELNEQLTLTKKSVTKMKNASNAGHTSTLSQESFEVQSTEDHTASIENKKGNIVLQNEENQAQPRESRSHNVFPKPSCQKSSVTRSVKKETPSSSLLDLTKSCAGKLLCSTSKCDGQCETTPGKKSEGKIPWSSQTEVKVKMNKAERLRMEFIKKKSATVEKNPSKNPRSVEDREKGWSFGKSNLLI